MPLSRALLAAAVVASAHAEEHFAVLVAGSNGFFNYRHQADVCHAYHVLINFGFNPDNIITMMYDDVASDSENPFPGKLYNYPWKTMEEAVDVYKGCKIDYRKEQVTPEKFMAVLTGDEAKAGGRVLKSSGDDHVFVNFVDHGAEGLIAFPDGADVLHAKQLIATLKTMHQKNMFKQLTFYLETCESGSMFEGILPSDLPVYALTAANAKESSWGTYCGSDAKVGGKDVGSCLGDLFSVNWMMDSDKDALRSNRAETLLQQYLAVKNLTAKSHVMQYGQVQTFDKEYVQDFQGPKKDREPLPERLLTAAEGDRRTASAVPARDVTLRILYERYEAAGTPEAADRLVAEIRRREEAAALSRALTASVGAALDGPAPATTWTPELLDCHEAAVREFGAACGWSEHKLVVSGALYSTCAHTSGDAAAVRAAVRRACGSGVEPVVV